MYFIDVVSSFESLILIENFSPKNSKGIRKEAHQKFHEHESFTYKAVANNDEQEKRIFNDSLSFKHFLYMFKHIVPRNAIKLPAFFKENK